MAVKNGAIEIITPTFEAKEYVKAMFSNPFKAISFNI